MSNPPLKIRVTSKFLEGQEGTVVKRIPGNRFWIINMDSGKKAVLHEEEFIRLKNEKLLHNERGVEECLK